MKNRAVFLDRDGTINRDVGFPSSWDQIEIHPFSFTAVRRLNRAGFRVAVVTNQSGIARGLIEESALLDIHRRMEDAFLRKGARIDAFYYCPHHPEGRVERFRSECPCRKPRPGMAARAARDLEIDPARSYMVGDKLEDLRFGVNCGAVPILVLTGYGETTRDRLKDAGLYPAHVASDLGDAVNWILDREKKRGGSG